MSKSDHQLGFDPDPDWIRILSHVPESSKLQRDDIRTVACRFKAIHFISRVSSPLLQQKAAQGFQFVRCLIPSLPLLASHTRYSSKTLNSYYFLISTSWTSISLVFFSIIYFYWVFHDLNLDSTVYGVVFGCTQIEIRFNILLGWDKPSVMNGFSSFLPLNLKLMTVWILDWRCLTYCCSCVFALELKSI